MEFCERLREEFKNSEFGNYDEFLDMKTKEIEQNSEILLDETIDIIADMHSQNMTNEKIVEKDAENLTE